MDTVLNDRIRYQGLEEKVVSAETAASWIKDGMVLGMSISPVNIHLARYMPALPVNGSVQLLSLRKWFWKKLSAC